MVERTAALAAAREAVAVARIAGAIEAMISVGGDALCMRIVRALRPIEPSIVALRFDDPDLGSCETAAADIDGAAGVNADEAGDDSQQTLAAAQKVALPTADAQPRRVLPLRLPSGRRLVVELTAAPGAGVLGDLALGRGESAAILDVRGNVVAAVGDGATPAALAAIANTYAAISASRFEARLPDGRWMFLALENVQGSDLVAVAMAPLATIHGSARRDLVVAVALSLGFLLIAVCVAWWGVDRLVVRWVGRLARVASLYGAGRQSVRVGQLEGAPQEIRVLGATFDDMADRVERRSNELITALDGKTGLLRELHHRVKNNFQLVASLLNLEARGSPPEQAAALNLQQSRIHAMAIAHRLAYASGEIGDVQAGVLVAEVIEGIRQNAALAARSVDIATVADDVVLDLDTAIPLALLVTEIANPIAAAAAASGGVLRVHQHCVGAAMTIVMSGPAVAVREGLSERLVAAFRRQLNATIDSSAPGSVTITLTAPQPPLRPQIA